MGHVAGIEPGQFSRKGEDNTMAKATFGAGCFWGVEAAFRRVKGVTSTTVGYSGGHFKNPTYQGITTQFWNSCDFICGPEEWKPWGVVNCGKGQPGQVAEITHGAAPARFRNVRVGAGYDE